MTTNILAILPSASADRLLLTRSGTEFCMLMGHYRPVPLDPPSRALSELGSGSAPKALGSAAPSGRGSSAQSSTHPCSHPWWSG